MRVPGLLSAQGSGAGYSSLGSINDAAGNVNTTGAPFDQVFDYKYSLTLRPDAEGEQYDFDPNDDPVMQAFFDAYEEARKSAYKDAKEWFMAWLNKNRKSTPKD